MYNKLQAEDDECIVAAMSSNKIRLMSGTLTAAMATTLLLLLVTLSSLWGIVDASRRALEAFSDPQKRCWCGETDAEALIIGCRYDHLTVDWLQPRCIDAALTDLFDSSGPNTDGTWQYYGRNNTNGLVPDFFPILPSQVDQYAKEGRDYFATTEWHIEHCLFIWRKQFRAARGLVELEPWNDDEAHIEHCSQYIMDSLRRKRPLDQIDTAILGKDRHVQERA